jgi:hypothetical protein
MVSKDPPTDRASSNAPPTPPQEPEIIDLSVEVTYKPIVRPGIDFPRFNEGDVVIELGGPTLKSKYQLHSYILRRASPWFDDTMAQPVKEFDDRIAVIFTKRTRIAARYEMIYNSNLNTLVLARTVSSRYEEFLSVLEQNDITSFLGQCSYFLQTLTKIKTPEKTVPVEGTKVTSVNQNPTSTDEVARVPSNIQLSTPRATSNIQPNIQIPTTDSGTTIAALQAPQSAQVGALATETLALDDVPTGPQSSIGNAPATESLPEVKAEVKAEEPEIKKEGEPSNSLTTVESEEPEIKKEEVSNSGERIKNVITFKGNSIAAKDATTNNENQVATKETPSTTEELHIAMEKATQLSGELLSAYRNLFLIYYGRAPIIDTKDIDTALQQAEILIRIAELYGSIPVVRPYLGNCMMQFGRDVYTAILQDPPRWLQLSLYLESAPIFKEAIIHIVGNLPNWPWSTVQLRDFPDDLKGSKGLFESKLDYLEGLQRDVDRKLTMSSIKINGEEAQLDHENKRTYNTWLVLQLWKSWFTRSISKGGSPNSSVCSSGTVYRLISKGGDVYLPSETIVTQIKALRDLNRVVKGDKQEIEEDLKLMKDFAQKEVRLLCVNNSMLSVEEAGIEHLTCTMVENDELPWVKNDGV